jgi:4-oxalocrotonate tautomerase
VAFGKKRKAESRELPMPFVQITMLEGRTAEQKRKLAKRITDAMVEEGGARREVIVVAFHEVSNRKLCHRRRVDDG